MNKNIHSEVAYIHGRPTGHPIHQAYAKSINADFYPVDFYLRWHDRPNSNRFRRYLSWLLCAFFFPNKKSYAIFFTECIRFPVIIMRWLGLLYREQRIIALMANEALYFIYTKNYSSTASFAMKKYLRSCDAIICVGKMQANLAREILKENRPPIYTIYNGINIERFQKKISTSQSLSSKKILFISNVDVEWRAWYKGTDLMFKAFDIVSKTIPDATFILIGRWDNTLFNQQVNRYCASTKNNIVNIGYTDKLETYIGDASIYLHCARGDAFPTTTMEVMAAGVVPIISEWTGTKEIVEQVDVRLVVPLDEVRIAEKIIWYLNLPISEKTMLSEKCKEVIKKYTEENAIQNFKEIFIEIANDFKILL